MGPVWSDRSGLVRSGSAWAGSTVKTHLGSVQLKPAARNRVEVAAWAWRTGHM
jgi:hypothetical protein